MSDLSHIDENGRARMVDVSAKAATARTARAEGALVCRTATLDAALAGTTPKGAVISTAEIAGVMAAKRTAELIPLCHPLALSHVGVELQVLADGVEIVASAETTAQTGVEMEALTAASVAALTVYDMAKAIDKQMTFFVELLEKVKGDVGLTESPKSEPPAWPAAEAGRQ